jgi:transposase
LSGGEAHDCPPAQRLIRCTKRAKKLLGDKAYDSAELRQWLDGRGTRAVIPNRSNRKQPFRFDKKSYKQRHLIENAFCRLKDYLLSKRCHEMSLSSRNLSPSVKRPPHRVHEGINPVDNPPGEL